MEKTCKTCRFFSIQTDTNGGFAQNRSSAKINCTAPGKYVSTDLGANQEQKENAFNLVVRKYDGIPDECKSYSEGENNYYNCRNCRNAIVDKKPSTLPNAIQSSGIPGPSAYAVVACQVKKPCDNLPVAKIVFANPIASSTLTPVACAFFSPDDMPAKPYHLAEVIKPGLQTLEQRIAAKYNSRVNKLPKHLFIMLLTAYSDTNCDIYKSLANQSNQGFEMTAKQMVVIENLSAYVSRISKKRMARWAARIDALVSRKGEGEFEYDVSKYKELLLKFGYLTELQEKRLNEAEQKEYGEEYTNIMRGLKQSADEEADTKVEEKDIDEILSTRVKTKFRRKRAFR